MASIEVPIPEKLTESNCFRPKLSIRSAATTVPSTLIVPTSAEASSPLLTPAYKMGHALDFLSAYSMAAFNSARAVIIMKYALFKVALP